MLREPETFKEAQEEIDLSELFQALWSRKVGICALTGIAAVASLTFALWLPNVYESTALLAPRADSGGSNGLSGLASQYGNLASLAGINLTGLGGESIPRARLAQAKVRSLSFFKENLYDMILLDLVAVESWDPETREVIYDPNIYDTKTQQWVRVVEPPMTPKPSPQESHQLFLDALSINEDKLTGLVTIGVEHRSPDVAAYWVEQILEKVSSDMRTGDIFKAQESITFLEEQRTQTNLVSLDGMFADLIEEQTKVIMLANVTKNYVFDVIDPPVASEVKKSPQRAAICILGTMLGAMLGLIYAFMSYFWRASSS